MYKCLWCNHLFEEGEEHRWIEPHGEPMKGCPICDAAYEETKACKSCGSHHFVDELHGGLCNECLSDSITYNKFLEYLIGDGDKDDNILPKFMFEHVFESPSPDRASEKLLSALQEWFLRQKANDLITNKREFLRICQDFIMNDPYGPQDWAYWLERREKCQSEEKPQTA